MAQTQPGATELAAARKAEAVGAEMYAYDQAAWHATDRLMEDLKAGGMDIQAFTARGARGYVVEPGSGGLVATFFGVRAGHRFAMARYEVTGEGVAKGGLVPADGAAELSLLAGRLIDARDAAIAAAAKEGFAPCTSSPPNTLALPRPDGGIAVYLLSSTTERYAYPMGGHYRFDFDANGVPTGSRKFMNSCLAAQFGPNSRGDKPVMTFVTHLLDSQPTEIHAFVSRNIPVVLMVGIVQRREVWAADHGAIRFVQDIADKPPASH